MRQIYCLIEVLLENFYFPTDAQLGWEAEEEEDR